jgi:predicted phosphodiesterase
MRLAVLSDIHANLLALEAVLNDAAERGAERFWCLGDMVGYYTDPVEALMFVKNYVDPDDWVMGNHDAMLADLIFPQDADFHSEGVELMSKAGPIRVRARFLSREDWQKTGASPIRALQINRRELDEHVGATVFWRSQFTEERMAPRRVQLNGREYIRAHASLHGFVTRYIYPWQKEIHLPEELAALEATRMSNAPQTLFFGHTHVPTLVLGEKNEKHGKGFNIEAVFLEFFKPYSLDGRWALINPGSVGQPRDGDRRASYVILDTDTHQVSFIRVEYPYRETAHRLLQKGYPGTLATRLLECPPVKEMPDLWKNHYAKNGTEPP